MSERIDEAVGETRALLDERQAPDLTAAVMSQIEHLELLPAAPRGSAWQQLMASLWAPRQVSIRPAYALASAALIVVAVLAPTLLNDDGADEPLAGEPQMFVQFRLEAMASRVQLAGSFTNWEPRYELRQAVPGVWSITVPLTQGVHDYAFIVDGQQWVADPYAPQIGDGFGGTNNRLALPPPGSPQL